MIPSSGTNNGRWGCADRMQRRGHCSPMPFEARALRVQLPCGSRSAFEAEEYDAEIMARQYWKDVFAGGCTPTDKCVGHSEVDVLCAGTEPLAFTTVVDARVLPILRRQLEAKLQEIKAAQEAVAKKMAGS